MHEVLSRPMPLQVLFITLLIFLVVFLVGLFFLKRHGARLGEASIDEGASSALNPSSSASASSVQSASTSNTSSAQSAQP